MCSGAPAAQTDSGESREYLTDAQISEFSSALNEVSGLDPESVDRLEIAMTKFKENSTDEEAVEGFVSFCHFIFGRYSSNSNDMIHHICEILKCFP